MERMLSACWCGDGNAGSWHQDYTSSGSAELKCTSLLSNVALILHQRKVGDFKKRVSLYSVYICDILCIIFL